MMNSNPLAFLRERTIQSMQREGLFNMHFYAPSGDGYWDNTRRSGCQTGFCLAGHICAAAGLDLEHLPAGSVSIAARRMWAIVYGWHQADVLNFAEEWNFGGDYREPSLDEVIRHLKELAE